MPACIESEASDRGALPRPTKRSHEASSTQSPPSPPHPKTLTFNLSAIFAKNLPFSWCLLPQNEPSRMWQTLPGNSQERIRMNKTTILALTFLLCTPTIFAHDDVFPGKGRKSDWIAANTLFNEALAHYRHGRIDLAIRLYKKAIAKYPYDADYYDNLGHAYEDKKGDLQLAGQIYRQGIKTEPDRARIKISYAGLLFEQHKIAESKRLIEEVSKYSNLSAEETLAIKKARQLLSK
jgi:hypothetical protein